MDKQEEIWRPVKGYEGFYEVSNRGRVRSVGRWVTDKNGRKVFRKGKILKPTRDKDGYLHVTLSRDGKHCCFTVHRMVAMAFIPNPENKPEVNHLNEQKDMNFVENLSYCTRIENVRWGTGNKRRTASRSKAVLALDPETGLVILEFPSAKEAGRKGFTQSRVSACCRGEQRTHHGLIWRYKPISNYSRMLVLYDIALEQCRRKAKTVGTSEEFKDFGVKIC